MTFLKATLLATTDVADQKRTVVHFMHGGAYAGGLPDEVAATITGEPWVEDWRVMNLPGRMETHRALISDYKNYAARFDAVADYLKQQRPPALMLWGRHDAFFDIAETLSWMQDLPRMEAHI
jgi:pimeloyl-ACP methyl ester carboxylesterase